MSSHYCIMQSLQSLFFCCLQQSIHWSTLVFHSVLLHHTFPTVLSVYKHLSHSVKTICQANLTHLSSIKWWLNHSISLMLPILWVQYHSLASFQNNWTSCSWAIMIVNNLFCCALVRYTKIKCWCYEFDVSSKHVIVWTTRTNSTELHKPSPNGIDNDRRDFMAVHLH